MCWCGDLVCVGGFVSLAFVSLLSAWILFVGVTAMMLIVMMVGFVAVGVLLFEGVLGEGWLWTIIMGFAEVVVGGLVGVAQWLGFFVGAYRHVCDCL